jgi:hypothetical protein
MISLESQMERRCRDSFARQQAMATIGHRCMPCARVKLSS